MENEQKLFDLIFGSYAAVRVTENRSQPVISGAFVIDLLSNVWQKIAGSLSVDVFEPEVIGVRGSTTATGQPKTRRSIGTDKYRVYIDKVNDSTLLTVKLIDLEQVDTATLKQNDIPLSIKDFEDMEVKFNLKTPGKYDLELVNSIDDSVYVRNDINILF
jgi:hypothetical protein